MEQPTIRQLEYLVAVADHRHFGRAAEQCAVSQPALSTQVREAERRLGTTVFERAPSGVLVTPAGEAIVARARIVLRDLAELMEVATGDRIRGRIELGVIPTMAPYLLPGILATLRAAWPGVRVALHEEKTVRLVDHLQDGSLDLALLALPVEADDLEQRALADEPFLLALPEGHDLAGSGRLPLGVLSGLPLLLLDDGHCLRDQALEACAVAGVAPGSEISSASLPTLSQMVAGGLGVTLLPVSAAAVEARPGSGLTTRPFRDPPPRRTVGLAWRRSSPYVESWHRMADLLEPVVTRLVTP
jgi:LysR family hydrogen peroxide-inducible transcriptional activator